MFENSVGPITLHPNFANDQARRVAESCVPFADDPARVKMVWCELAARAERFGWRLPPESETTEDPALRVLLDDRSFAPVSAAEGRYVFVLPGAGLMARLVSRRTVQSDTARWVADHRQLGVMVSSLCLRAGGLVVAIPLDHPDLDVGWWQPEWHGRNELRRWANGDAVVPMPKGVLETGKLMVAGSRVRDGALSVARRDKGRNSRSFRETTRFA
jgi:hypothetical protein